MTPTEIAAAAAPSSNCAPRFLSSWAPSIVLQVLYPDSRKVGFGWILFLVSTAAAFWLKNKDAKPLIDASTWLLTVTATTALIGGGTIADDKHDREMAKINGGIDAPVPAGTPGAAA